MLDYKKTSYVLFFLFLLVSFVVKSDNRTVKITEFNGEFHQKVIKVQAHLDFQLSDIARDALHNGIELYWDVILSFKQVQGFGLWSRELGLQQYRYRLSYHTLLNNYRVQYLRDEGIRRFLYLADALLYMSELNYEYQLQKGRYDEERCIQVELKVLFDKEALPVPLRPFVYFEYEWDLSAYARIECV